MSLAIRELELILIARDNASAVIARVGGGLAILGGIITRIGIKGAKSLAEMTQEAVEFRQEIALAVTQSDDLGATIENVAAIVNRVGKDLPVPFEELNEAMFDIFSTFTKDQLSSLEQAEMILRAFGESAVAGQAPVRDIARSTIAWINALDQPATLENITKLLDIQFELVRKGAGTYGEFAGEVGKSIPAFAAANQTVETFGGIMAFLTKNGLNAAMAATSAARAAELMFAPKAIKGLRAIGIAVEDDNGKFRGMDDIIRDLVPVMGGLSDAAFKLKFKEIFGTGRIQARRFFDLAIPNFEELEFLIGEMETAGGGVASAFAFMFEQPQSQLELFRNKWEVLRRTIGDTFIKHLQSTVFPALDKLFDWWDKLTPEMQAQIAEWASWAAVIAIVGGAILVTLGIGLIFVALLKSFSGTSAVAGIAKLAISLGWVGLVLAAIAVAAFLIWKNWDKIWPFLVGVWDKVLDAVEQFVKTNKKFFEEVAKKAKIIWGKILKLGTSIWKRAKAIWSAIWNAMLTFWDRWGKDIMATISTVWENIKSTFLLAMDIIISTIDLFIALFEGDWAGMWEAVKRIASIAWDFIKGKFETFTAILSQIWRIAWDFIKEHATKIWEGIKSFLADIWKGIKNTASKIWNGIVDFFKGIWNSITGTAKDTIDGKGGLLEFFQKLPGRIIEAVFNLAALLIEWIGRSLGALLTAAMDKGAAILIWFAELPFRILSKLPGAVSWLWSTGKAILKGLWKGIKWWWSNIVVPFWTGLLPAIVRFIGRAGTWLWMTGLSILKGLWNGILWFWNNLLLPWLKDIPDKVRAGVGNIARALWNAGWSVIDGLWKGMQAQWRRVTSWLGGLASTIAAWKGPKSVDLKILVENGDAIMQGLETGMMKGFRARVQPLLEDMTLRGIPGAAPSTFLPSNTTTNDNRIEQTFQFGDIISQADPDEIAQAMAWELRMV